MRRILLCWTEPESRIQIYRFVGTAYNLLMDSFKLSDFGEKLFTSVWVLREEDYKKKIVPFMLRSRKLLEELLLDDVLNLQLPRELEDLRLLVIQVWFDEDLIDNVDFNLKQLRSLISIKGGDMEVSRIIKLGEEILYSKEEDPKSVVAFNVLFVNYGYYCPNVLTGLIFFRDKIIYSYLARLTISETSVEYAKIIKELSVDKLKYIDNEEELLKLFCENFGMVIR
jgi:hypothetical protein